MSSGSPTLFIMGIELKAESGNIPRLTSLSTINCHSEISTAACTRIINFSNSQDLVCFKVGKYGVIIKSGYNIFFKKKIVKKKIKSYFSKEISKNNTRKRK